MAKRDRVKQRLEYWREQLDSGFPHPSDSRLPALPGGLIKYLRFKSGGADPGSLKRAAEYFGIDPAHKHESDVLLRILADVIFAKPERGRPKGSRTWRESRLLRLGWHLHDLENRAGRLSDTDAAKELVKLRNYKNQKWQSLRQRLASAREQLEVAQLVLLVRKRDRTPEEQRRLEAFFEWAAQKQQERNANQTPGVAAKLMRAPLFLQSVK